MVRKIIQKIARLSGCEKYRLPLWECPSFLFFLMGIINILSSLFFYYLGNKYIDNPALVAMGVLILAAIWFVISFFITRGLEELAEVNKIKEEFIDIVSHQLRTPLTNLKWAIQFLIAKKRQPENNEYYTIIKENSQRIENLLNDLLIVARLKEDGIFRIREKFSLRELIEEVVRGNRSFAEASNVSIEIEDRAEVPIFLATNRAMLKTVLENLISNAIIYNKPKGKVVIVLQKAPKEVIIAIQDTGLGIAKEDQKYLFQKFFRGKNAAQKNTRGTGLGLYIAKEVLKKLGGKIWFKSKLNQGSTFYISLPIKT